MLSMMMNRPLSIIEILQYAAQNHLGAEVVSVRTEGDLHRQDYAQTYRRAAQLAHALAKLGVTQGDRVATLAWNGHRHLELYYAISGMGAVCHTINPRLSAEQMTYIVGHAEDRLLCLDVTFVPIIEALRDHLPAGLIFVVMTDRAHMPEAARDMLCYEDLLDGQPDTYDWPDLPEETAAALCYTSGTTGNPKGALYSHRSTVLHAFYCAVTIPRSLHEGARILPVVPMFHVNSWGLPYSGPLVGMSMIMPGAKLDGGSLYDLMQSEGVTASWGVPTVWLGLVAEIAKRGVKPSQLVQLGIGGSAVPRSMIETFEGFGIDVAHAWGMTEMSPLGTHGQVPAGLRDLSESERIDMKVTQGRRIFGVDLKIVDETGAPLPHDGVAQGALFVRGNAVISGYYNNPDATQAAMDADGWFGTDDVARIDPRGFVTLVDRTKDLIKSGGEWISSIDLENVVMAHENVANCAVIAVPHAKWGERPLLIVVPTGAPPSKDAIDALLLEHVAKWQLPDDMVLVEALPLTATGKVSKLQLRAQFTNHVLPGVG